MTAARLILIAAGFAMPAALHAQMAGMADAAAAPCPAVAAPLPPALAAFRGPTAMAASTGATPPVLAAGAAAALALAPAATLVWPVKPVKPGAAGSFGGIVALDVAAPGLYRFALSSGVWLDVARDGALLPSVAHAPGPACSGIRKLVDFRLERGRYLIEIAESRDPGVTLLAAPLP